MVVVVCDIEIWSIEKRFGSEVVRIGFFERNVTTRNKRSPRSILCVEKVSTIKGDILKIGRQKTQGHARENAAMLQSKNRLGS